MRVRPHVRQPVGAVCQSFARLFAVQNLACVDSRTYNTINLSQQACAARREASALCRALSGHLSKRAQRREAAVADDEASSAPTEADAVAAAALEVAATETPAEQAAQGDDEVSQMPGWRSDLRHVRIWSEGSNAHSVLSCMRSSHVAVHLKLQGRSALGR